MTNLFSLKKSNAVKVLLVSSNFLQTNGQKKYLYFLYKLET